MDPCVEAAEMKVCQSDAGILEAAFTAFAVDREKNFTLRLFMQCLFKPRIMLLHFSMATTAGRLEGVVSVLESQQESYFSLEAL